MPFARHLLAALVALLPRSPPPNPCFAQAPNPNPSPAAILIAKQILEIKGQGKLFDPLVRGVIEKAKDEFMQTNFMWAKDLNEVAANMEKEYAPRVRRTGGCRARASMPAISPRRSSGRSWPSTNRRSAAR